MASTWTFVVFASLNRLSLTLMAGQLLSSRCINGIVIDCQMTLSRVNDYTDLQSDWVGKCSDWQFDVHPRRRRISSDYNKRLLLLSINRKEPLWRSNKTSVMKKRKQNSITTMYLEISWLVILSSLPLIQIWGQTNDDRAPHSGMYIPIRRNRLITS